MYTCQQNLKMSAILKKQVLLLPHEITGMVYLIQMSLFIVIHALVPESEMHQCLFSQ